ncbi:MAG: hypothetical protein ACRD2K_03415 [Terriglobales bacterium]
MDDRALQDDLIRYLSDARLRAVPPESPKLTHDEAGKAQKFARFLARRYYRDRLIRSFRYSRLFSAAAGRKAEEICDSEAFEPFLDQCVLGSVDSARRASEMAVAHLAPGQRLFPWWSSLIEYESAHLLQTATTERAQPGQHYQRAASATCKRFDWALPEMLPRLRRGETAGEEFRRSATLLFSRTHIGKIYVVELDKRTEEVFSAVDGSRTAKQIAESAGITLQQAEEILNNLAQIGAVEKPV